MDSDLIPRSNATSTLEAMRRVIDAEADSLRRMAATLDESAAVVAELLAGLTGCVATTGIGKSGLIARKTAATFCSVGAPARFLHPVEALHGDLGALVGCGALLAFSASGESVELLDLLPHVRPYGAAVVALTCTRTSSLARRSDHVVAIGELDEADPWGLLPTASATMLLALGDALAVAVAQRRGFDRAAFSATHPGGRIGRRLRMKVADLMRRAPDLPVVRRDATLREAVSCMSRMAMGAVFVVDAVDTLAGVFTDGDLRRLVESRRDALDRCIDEVMTRTPRAVAPDCSAFEALQFLERSKIAALPVVDPDGRLVGALHLHRLVEAGLA